MIAAMAAGLLGGLLLSIPLSRSLSQKKPADQRNETIKASTRNPFAAWMGFIRRDIVVLGVDASGGNTDAIFTIKIEDGTTKITQIPRDSYIDSNSFGPLKANALHAYGGPDAVKNELTRLMGRQIQHHIIVNLDGVYTLADLVGGVEVNVPKRLYYVDRSAGLTINLHPGPQILKGSDLEGFLRWRHDEDGDLGRLERQQLVLRSLFNKLTNPANLVRLPSLIAAAGENLTTDMGPMEIGGLITAMGNTQLQTTRLDSTPFYRNGISYLETEWPAHSSHPEQDHETVSNLQDRYVF